MIMLLSIVYTNSGKNERNETKSQKLHNKERHLSEEIYKTWKMYKSRIQEKLIVYVHKLEYFIYLQMLRVMLKRRKLKHGKFKR